MKKLLLGLLLLGSVTTYANEYCYDRAVFATYDLIEDIQKCDGTLPVGKLNSFAKKLQRVHPGYRLKIANAMAKLYKYMHTDLPYSYTESKETQRCLEKIGRNSFEDFKIQVMDSMVLCGL